MPDDLQESLFRGGLLSSDPVPDDLRQDSLFRGGPSDPVPAGPWPDDRSLKGRGPDGRGEARGP